MTIKTSLGLLTQQVYAFQKKSKHGIATPKKEMDLIEARFKRAQEDNERRKK